MPNPKKYFDAVQLDEDNLEITIYGDITSWPWYQSDVSSYTLSKLIQESTAKNICVNINSYGGEVAEGLAIHNALRHSGAKIITRCDGFACSSASVVFMAGDERVMNEASLLMIHNAWTYAAGNAEELRKQADDLDVISQTVAKTYQNHITISAEELQKMLDDETWITPADAVQMGFATKIVEDSRTAKQQYSARNTVIERVLSGTKKKEQEKAPVAPVQQPEQMEKPLEAEPLKEEPEKKAPEQTGFQKLFCNFK